jgi:protein TonB
LYHLNHSILDTNGGGDMFNTLLESKRAKQRNIGSTITSAVLHVLLVVGAVAATKKGEQILNAQEDEQITMADLPPEEKPPEKEPPPPEKSDTPPPADATAGPPPPKGFTVLQAPINIPTAIPQVDLSARVTNEMDFSAKGVAGGISTGVAGGTGTVNVNQPYFAFEVEKMAAALPGNKEPKYPEILRSTKQTGQVLVGFIVDTTGKADMSSFTVIESTNELFTAEVKKVLPSYNFRPAEISGRKVRVHVRLPFEFTLIGGGN